MNTKSIGLKLPAVLSLALLVVMGGLFFASPQVHAQTLQAKDQGDGLGVPFTTAKKIVKLTPATSRSQLVDTIPFWSSLFSYAGSPFPFQMVGTDPSSGSATTVVPTAVIPLDITFSNGVTLKGSRKLNATLKSPLFEKANYTSGFTQYGDAIQRAEFWKYVSKSSKHYHVLLGDPKVYSTVSFTVPAKVGQEVKGKRTKASIGLIEGNWFDSQIQALLTQLHLSPKTFPIFLVYNTFLYAGDKSQCCTLGYHNALFSTDAQGKSVIQTYAFGAYSDPGIFGSMPIEDIHALSHEVSEWYNDPFVDNVTPTWSVPSQPLYGCSNSLEVGDPVVGIGFKVNGYHPEDEVFFSWFAKQVPSIGIKGQYTYLGTFTSPSPTC